MSLFRKDVMPTSASLMESVNLEESFEVDNARGSFIGEFGDSGHFGTQVEKSISRVRWVGPNDGIGITDGLAPEYFVVATYADQFNDVSLWKLEIIETEEKNLLATKLIHKTSIIGNLLGLEVLDNDHFALTSSEGALSVFKLNQKPFASSYDPTSFQVMDSQKLHSFRPNLPAPATDLVALDPSMLVSVGEDGSVIQYSVRTQDVIRTMQGADPLAINVVISIGRNEVVTGNDGGQVKVWDLRAQSTEPVITLCPNILLNTLCGATSLAQYPSQSHLIFSGYQSGCMDLWDIRRGSGTQPTANLVGEGSGAISEMKFHAVNEDHFFTCNQDGAATHWFPSEEIDEEMVARNLEGFADLNLEFLRKGLNFMDIYTSPLAINSISVSPNDRLLCGGDSGVAVICDLAGV